jgi:Zn finger protein HypA/HybF involved in hydrogenase expression
MAKMNIRCKRCDYSETLDKRFIVKVLGGVVAGFGFWAWVAFLFAGTGLALPICIAIVTGGVAIAAFSDEIAEWVSARYPCPKCGAKHWKVEKR